jgi:hypothetical protein
VIFTRDDVDVDDVDDDDDDDYVVPHRRMPGYNSKLYFNS